MAISLINQYKIITNGSSIDNKNIDEKGNLGKSGLHFIVNEGYPNLCIVNKGHLFKNGSFVRILNSNNKSPRIIKLGKDNKTIVELLYFGSCEINKKERGNKKYQGAIV